MKRLAWTVTLVLGLMVGGSADPAAAPPAPQPERPSLTAEQHQQLEDRANAAWNGLSLHEKQQALRVYRGLKLMPAEERSFIQDRLERFIHMTPEERKRLRENAERWRTMTPEQRQKAREAFRRHRQEFEARWRREHPGEEPPPFPYRKHTPSPPAEGGAAPEGGTRSPSREPEATPPVPAPAEPGT